MGNALSIWEPVCNEIFDRLIKHAGRLDNEACPCHSKAYHTYQSTEDTSSPAPAAPMVDSLMRAWVLWPAVMLSLFRYVDGSKIYP